MSLTGSNFYEAKNLKVSLELANGERATVPLAITNTTTASFTMPDGVGLGVKDVTLTQGSSQVEVARFNLIVDQADNQLPIWIGDASEICNTRDYIDRNGETKTGTKDCASGVTPPACSENGSIGRVTTETYKAADLTNLSASSIKSGVTIAGVTGTVTQSPGNCENDGDVGCVVLGPSFAAAATTGAASKILSGQSVAGVAGNVTLPAAGKVLTGNTYGVSGTGSTGTLTIPAAGNVLSTAPAYGDPGAQLTPSLANQGSYDLSTTFPGAGYYSGTTNAPTAATIASGTTITGVAGSATLSPGDCWASGQQWCVANGSYFAGTMCLGNDSNCFIEDFGGPNLLKAVNYSSILTNASNIRSGVTISDVTGTLDDCSANAVTGCVTTVTYQSADLTNLAAGNIKSGVTIAGTAGQYPSSSFKLTGSSGSDLTTATFNAQIKSSSTFQYFGSDGTRFTGTGDDDITAANIASGVDIFGASGSLSGAVAPDPWNVRVGVTVNGVTGKLKVNCRNRVSTSSPPIYNYDGAIGSIGTAGQTGGSVRDIWDTIDDYNNNQVGGVPGGIVATWTSSTDCYGVESGAGDDNVWKDVTTTNGTTASTCTATPANCTMQDKITGLSWSKLQASAAWNTAWSNCQSLNYNGQTGWRLPTQKELLEAYTHGIRSVPSSYAAASTNWMTEANMYSYFWSGSSASNLTGYAWYVNLANGVPTFNAKGLSYQAVCVR